VLPDPLQSELMDYPADHLVPCQCKAWLRSLLPTLPTAQQLVATVQR
jgi:hypothetical protein